MNRKSAVAIVVVLLAGIAASAFRDRGPSLGRHVIIYLNDFGQITRVENNSGMSLDVSGLKIKTK